MKPTLEDALVLAAQKHRGQFDKAGEPYILHPLRVMHNLGQGATQYERMAALLHDVVEDCDISLDDLCALNYPPEVVRAVGLLTKNDEGKRDYQKAIERVAPNPIARRVKIADLTDNLNINHISKPCSKDYERLEKYRAAKKFLEEWPNVQK